MFKRIQPLPGRARPLVFAHRGLSADAPENTMGAFRLARSVGVPGIELDIHLSADGAIMVIHDDDTARVCPGSSLAVGQSRSQDLRKLDVGAWKAARWAGERIPVLAEVLEELKGDLYFDIEIKGRSTHDLGLEAALADLLADFKLDASSVVVSSFNPIILRRFKVLAPHIPTAIIYCDSDELPRYLRRGEGRWIAAADFLKPKSTELSPGRVRLGHSLGLRPVVPWTVDQPDEAAALLKAGCVGLVSNQPHRLGLPLSVR